MGFDFVLKNAEREGRFAANVDPIFVIKDAQNLQTLIASGLNTKVLISSFPSPFFKAFNSRKSSVRFRFSRKRNYFACISACNQRSVEDLSHFE